MLNNKIWLHSFFFIYNIVSNVDLLFPKNKRLSTVQRSSIQVLEQIENLLCIRPDLSPHAFHKHRFCNYHTQGVNSTWISDYVETTFLYLERFLKKSAINALLYLTVVSAISNMCTYIYITFYQYPVLTRN